MVNRQPVSLILNSAHGKYPIGSEPWIQKTVCAVQSLAEEQPKMLCSTEPVMWDLVTALASSSGMEIILIVKAHDDSKGHREFQKIIDDYALNENRTSPLYLGEDAVNQPKKLWRLRDRLALRTADIVYPVSIRPGGRLETMLLKGEFREVRNDFRISWSHESHPVQIPVYDFSGCTVNPFPGGDWLVHWTRSSQGPWSCEKAWEFYRDLLERPDIYVRSARETLIKILADKMIWGSSWKIPTGAKAISFTSLTPEEAVSLMRWRKRFVRYSFEPYGIAIKRDILTYLGTREISYEKPHGDSSREKIFMHSPGEKGDWIKEKEWRLPGDLRLDTLDRNDYFAIVPDKSEIEYIQKRLHGADKSFHELFRH